MTHDVTLCLWPTKLPSVYDLRSFPVSMIHEVTQFLWSTKLPCVYDPRSYPVSTDPRSYPVSTDHEVTMCLWPTKLPCVYDPQSYPVSTTPKVTLCRRTHEVTLCVRTTKIPCVYDPRSYSVSTTHEVTLCLRPTKLPCVYDPRSYPVSTDNEVTLCLRTTKLEVPAALVHWVFNFLSNRPQCVRVDDIKSPVLVSNTGAPQGCVLSPFLYTLYTNDCRSVDSSTQFVRFSDDTAMLALLNDFASYQSYLSSVVRFSSWCSKTFLHLNVSKTKEMCIHFRRNRTVISPIVINGELVEQVDSFKYLGVILNEKLSFTEHVTAVQKKSQQRLHVLRKLRAFYVDPLRSQVSGCLLQTAQTWANAGVCSASCAHAFGCMYVCLFIFLFVCLL